MYHSESQKDVERIYEFQCGLRAFIYKTRQKCKLDYWWIPYSNVIEINKKNIFKSLHISDPFRWKMHSVGLYMCMH